MEDHRSSEKKEYLVLVSTDEDHDANRICYDPDFTDYETFTGIEISIYEYAFHDIFCDRDPGNDADDGICDKA